MTSAVTDAVASETMRQRFYRVTAELLDIDPRVAIVLADIGVGYLEPLGVFERHPRRAINVGIREALMVSTAGGMALEGLRPIAQFRAGQARLRPPGRGRHPGQCRCQLRLGRGRPDPPCAGRRGAHWRAARLDDPRARPRRRARCRLARGGCLRRTGLHPTI